MYQQITPQHWTEGVADLAYVPAVIAEGSVYFDLTGAYVAKSEEEAKTSGVPSILDGVNLSDPASVATAYSDESSADVIGFAIPVPGDMLGQVFSGSTEDIADCLRFFAASMVAEDFTGIPADLIGLLGDLPQPTDEDVIAMLTDWASDPTPAPSMADLLADDLAGEIEDSDVDWHDDTSRYDG